MSSRGGSGQLLIRGVRGLSLFHEYLGNPRATADSFDPDGWFRTGDMINVLDDGSLQFGDRSKDMLKVGGENVAASEIERVVLQVAGVHECAVVAKKHPMLDEVPVLFVLPAAHAEIDLLERIAAACSAQLARLQAAAGGAHRQGLPALDAGEDRQGRAAAHARGRGTGRQLKTGDATPRRLPAAELGMCRIHRRNQNASARLI